MKLVIASRKSDLARVQAYSVGEALRSKNPSLEIEYHFRESLGDINLNDPLWKMPEKGVFTADLTVGLIDGKFDMVVHSWKDLPVETHPETAVVATMDREDQRDLLLIPRARYAEFMARPKASRHLRVLSSSPRRAHNLTPFLKTAWPEGLDSLEFIPVRGNIQTRIRKLFAGDGDCLILAKAAVDRLMTAEREEFRETREAVTAWLADSKWMVLPLSENPTAAAQGALAIEIAKKRKDLLPILNSIHNESTFEAVEQERKLLQEAGGGCHQKLGISIDPHGVLSIRGERPSGEPWLVRKKVLHTFSVFDALDAAHTEKVRTGGAEPTSGCVPPSLFDREAIVVEAPKADALYVSHPHALPKNWTGYDLDGKVLWAAGLMTWRALAVRGFWVNGTDDSLGEKEPEIEHLAPARSWVKLSHAEAPETMPVLATYRLIPKTFDAATIEGFTHYYWKSFSQFQRALELAPAIRSAHHSAGHGNTARLMRAFLGEADGNRVTTFLNEADWRQHFGFR